VGNPRAYLFGARAASAVRTLFVPALGEARILPAMPRLPLGELAVAPPRARGAPGTPSRTSARKHMHELAAGCGRRGQCAPNRSPSRASVTPCAVGAPSLGLRARLPSPDHLTPCSRTRRRTADGSRTAQIASHGRLTACRSRLTGYPDRAYDRRASPFFRRGALCMLACVVQGSRVHSVGFRTAVCVIRRPLFNLGSHTTL